MDNTPDRNVEQGTDDWFLQRSGKFTASEFWALVEKTKSGKFYSDRDKIIKRVAFERLTGRPARDEFSSRATEHGKTLEPYNIEAYEIRTGNIVEKVGFLLHPRFIFAGASPDGLVGTDGGVEAKSPKDHTIHIERLLDGMPHEMKWQCIGGMWVTGRQWWDWTSYDADLAAAEPALGLYVQRVECTQEEIDALEIAILQAEAEVQSLIKELRRRVA